jgi:hypothetical protein
MRRSRAAVSSDAVEVDVEEALAGHIRAGRGGGFADEAPEGAGGIALDGEDRVRHEARLVALLHDLREGESRRKGMLSFTTSSTVMSRRWPPRSISTSVRRRLGVPT